MRDPGPEDLLTVGEISRRTGVAVSALHFYEHKGLISSTRTPAGHRRYPRHMVRRISLVVIAKRVGISLDDVAAVLAGLPQHRAPTREEWQHVSEGWSEDLQRRREEIERLQQELTGCIGCGCLSMVACRLLNPGDWLAERGVGARRVQRRLL